MTETVKMKCNFVQALESRRLDISYTAQCSYNYGTTINCELTDRDISSAGFSNQMQREKVDERPLVSGLNCPENS